MICLFLVSLALLAIVMPSCTDNMMAKNFGGKTTINLDKGQKLVNMTWKDDNLWVLTTYMTPADSAKAYFFKESASFGMMNGEITVFETK